jgi:hypothetical protein
MLLAFASFLSFYPSSSFLLISFFPHVFLPFPLSFYDEVVTRVGQYIHIPQRLFVMAGVTLSTSDGSLSLKDTR